MPLLFILMMCLLGIGIAMFRRSPQAFLDGPAEDAPLRLMRWAVGLLSPQRHEWGQAMLGELDHLDGRIRRMRFTLGWVGAALVLPPWGRVAVGVWVVIAVAVASVGLYASVAIRYGLSVASWLAAAILAVFLAGYLRPRPAAARRGDPRGGRAGAPGTARTLGRDRPLHPRRPAGHDLGRPAADRPGPRDGRRGRSRGPGPPPPQFTCTDAARPVHPA